jgi:hypothetical protein
LIPNNSRLQPGLSTPIYVETGGNASLAVEHAETNVLMKYSGLAKKALSPRSARLTVSNASKEAVELIYEFMLAGQKESFAEGLGELSIENLAALYTAAREMECTYLTEKVFNYLEYLVVTGTTRSSKMIKTIATHVEGLADVVAKHIAIQLLESVSSVSSEYSYIKDVYKIEGIAAKIDTAFNLERKRLIGQSTLWHDHPYVERKPEAVAMCTWGTHTKPTFKKPKKPMRSNEICAICKEFGHIARHCDLIPVMENGEGLTTSTLKETAVHSLASSDLKHCVMIRFWNLR